MPDLNTGAGIFVGLCTVLQVRVYDYTCHLVESPLGEKIGGNLVLRRGCKSFSLMGFLVETGGIMKLTVSTLIDFMDHYGSRLPKNTTKAQRIRQILKMEHIREECSEEKMNDLLQLLEKQEERRKKKTDNQIEPGEEARNRNIRKMISSLLFLEDRSENRCPKQDEIQWQELEEDEATNACRELLRGQEDEDDEDDDASKLECVFCFSCSLSLSSLFSLSISCSISEEAKVSPELVGEPTSTVPSSSAAERPSRSMISSVCSLPPELLKDHPLPDGTSMNLVTHRDRTLPHFQGRLLNGETFEGKSLTCI